MKLHGRLSVCRRGPRTSSTDNNQTIVKESCTRRSALLRKRRALLPSAFGTAAKYGRYWTFSEDCLASENKYRETRRRRSRCHASSRLSRKSLALAISHFARQSGNMPTPRSAATEPAEERA